MGANQSKSDNNINSDNTLHFNNMSSSIQPITGGGYGNNTIKNDINNLILKLNIPQVSEVESEFNLSTFLNSKLDNEHEHQIIGGGDLSATSSAFISNPKNYKNNTNLLIGGAGKVKKNNSNKKGGKKKDDSSSSSTSSSDSSLDDSSEELSCNKTKPNKNKPCSKGSCHDGRNQSKSNKEKPKHEKPKHEKPKHEKPKHEYNENNEDVLTDTNTVTESIQEDEDEPTNFTGKLKKSAEHEYMSSSAHTGGELSQSSTEIFKNNNSSSALESISASVGSNKVSSASNENNKVNNYSISTSDINMISDL